MLILICCQRKVRSAMVCSVRPLIVDGTPACAWPSDVLVPPASLPPPQPVPARYAGLQQTLARALVDTFTQRPLSYWRGSSPAGTYQLQYGRQVVIITIRQLHSIQQIRCSCSATAILNGSLDCIAPACPHMLLLLWLLAPPAVHARWTVCFPLVAIAWAQFCRQQQERLRFPT